MTKAQKEEKARNEKKLQQMLAAGIKVGPQEDAPSEPKKKNEAPKKKSRQQQKVFIPLPLLLEYVFKLLLILSTRLMKRRPLLRPLSAPGYRQRRT
jgi:hypothetical protein